MISFVLVDTAVNVLPSPFAVLRQWLEQQFLPEIGHSLFACPSACLLHRCFAVFVLKESVVDGRRVDWRVWFHRFS